MRPKRDRGNNKIANNIRKNLRSMAGDRHPGGEGVYYSFEFDVGGENYRPIIPAQTLRRVKRWCRRTGGKVSWQWDFATTNSNSPLFDRGMCLSRGGEYDASLYASFKRALGFPQWLRVGNGDLEILFAKLGGEFEYCFGGNTYTCTIEAFI